MKKVKHLLLLTLSLCCLLLPEQSFSQKKNRNKNIETLSYDTSYMRNMEWRNLGPFRGGRSCAVTGVKGQRKI